MATTTTTTTSANSTPSSTPPNSANSLSPSFSMGHQRSKSLLASGAKSPNDFVFPRRPPSVTGGNTSTRPRSGTTDATTLLAEIGVLPPPIVTPGSGRMRAPQTPYYANGQRPQSMLALPTPHLPVTVTLAPAPGGRAHRRVTSDLPTLEQPVAAAKEEETPVKKAPPPGYQRRGHAHRRSGAISSSDVWGLLSQSAPSLPLPHGPQTKDGLTEATSGAPSPIQSWSAPVSPGVVSTPVQVTSAPAPPSPVPTPDPLDARRSNKVAFTDKIEIIPRPLSVASSLATVRAHGAQDSISSIADFSPPQQKTATTGLNRSPTRSRSSSISSSTSPLSAELQAQFAHITQRPSTAGAILASPALLIPAESVPVLKIEPVVTSQPSPVTSNVASPTSSPLKPSPSIAKKTHKKALSDGSPQTASPSGSDFFGNIKGEEDALSPKSKKGGKRKKKHLKNFLFGKGGSEKQTKTGKTGRPLKRSPTPPSRTNSFRNQAGQIEVLPAWNESYVYMPESAIMAGRSLEELSSTMSPRYNHPSGDRDSPVIDLDAALGPFDSPSLGSAGKSSGGFSAAKKRMHSSGAGGKLGIASGIGAGIGGAGFGAGFVGTHRRSESMPDMPLFALEENTRMEMDDVFEEDEEEEEYSSSGSDDGSESDESEDGRRRMSTGGLGIGIQVVDGEGSRSWEDGMTMDWSSPAARGRRSSLAPTVGSTNGSLRSESIREEEEPQEEAPINQTHITIAVTHEYGSHILDAPPSPRSPTSSVPSAQSSTSTVTPTSAISNSTVQTFPDTPTTSIASEALSTPSTPSQAPSNFSSSRNNSLTLKELAALSAQDPEFELYADPEFRFLGEPGPEMRMSVDDVPSLTSSSSTMTSSYAAYCIAGMQPSTPRLDETLGVVMPVDKNGKTKSIKKKWSKVFRFWESDDKKKDKEKDHSPKVEKEKKEKGVKEKKHKEKERI